MSYDLHDISEIGNRFKHRDPVHLGCVVAALDIEIYVHGQNAYRNMAEGSACTVRSLSKPESSGDKKRKS